VAGYSAVIDLRVNGLDGLRTVSDRIESINRLIKNIKPVPTLFDKRGSDELKRAKQDLDDLVKKYADGGSRSAAFASSIAGLNQQLTTFRSVAANAKVGSDQFTNSLKAAELATNKLISAELERFNTLKNLYTRRGVGGLSAEEQGPTGLTKSVLALGKQLPSNIAGLRAYESELSRVFNLVEAGSVDFRTLQTEIARVNRQLDIVTGAGPLQGPALPPGFTERGRRPGAGVPSASGPTSSINPFVRRGAAFENLALGAGFPLLFGGGVGQVSGGLLGSLVGTGFGGQILGSAIGQQLEDAQKRIAEIGNATKTLNMDALYASVLRVNAELDYQISLLLKAGEAEAARNAISKQVTLQTGLVPEAVTDITNNVNQLSASWNEFLGAASATLSIIGAPFVSALTLILQGLGKTLQLVNLISSGVLSGIARGLEWAIGNITELITGTRTEKALIEAVSEEEQKRIANLVRLTDTQNTELVQTSKLLDLEQKRTLGRTIAEKQINAALDDRIEKTKINAKFDKELNDLRTENAGVQSEQGKKQLELAVKQLEAKRSQSLQEQDIKNSLVEQGLVYEKLKNAQEMQIVNAEKALIPLQKATLEIEKQQKTLETRSSISTAYYQAENAVLSLQQQQLEREYSLAQTRTDRLQIAERLFQVAVALAKTEYQQAIESINFDTEKLKLNVQLEKSKINQIEAEASLQRLRVAGELEDSKRLAALQRIDTELTKTITSQNNVTAAAEEQLTAQTKIAQYQAVTAGAQLQSKVLTAQQQYEQKLVSSEIGFSAQNAQQLSNALVRSANITGTLASGMASVTSQASNAANQIQRVISMQGYAVTRASTAQTRTGTVYQAEYTYANGQTGSSYIKAHYAKGGYVTRPTVALIGEGGQPEFVIPQSKASAFAENWLSGRRGAEALPRMAAGASDTPPSINITTGPVMQQEGTKYVTLADMESAMQSMASAMLGNNRSYSGRRYQGVR
jgi:hypothetical protein